MASDQNHATAIDGLDTLVSAGGLMATYGLARLLDGIDTWYVDGIMHLGHHGGIDGVVDDLMRVFEADAKHLSMVHTDDEALRWPPEKFTGKQATRKATREGLDDDAYNGYPDAWPWTTMAHLHRQHADHPDYQDWVLWAATSTPPVPCHDDSKNQFRLTQRHDNFGKLVRGDDSGSRSPGVLHIDPDTFRDLLTRLLSQGPDLDRSGAGMRFSDLESMARPRYPRDDTGTQTSMTGHDAAEVWLSLHALPTFPLHVRQEITHTTGWHTAPPRWSSGKNPIWMAPLWARPMPYAQSQWLHRHPAIAPASELWQTTGTRDELDAASIGQVLGIRKLAYREGASNPEYVMSAPQPCTPATAPVTTRSPYSARDASPGHIAWSQA